METINDGAWFNGCDSISYQLPQGFYQWGQNITNRGGLIETRQGFAHIAARIGETEKPRGICLFSTKTQGSNPYLVVAIGSSIYALPYPYTAALDNSTKIPNISFPSSTRNVHFEVCVQAQETVTVGNGYETRNLRHGPRFVLIMQDGIANPAYWYYDQNTSHSGHITADWLRNQGLSPNPLIKAEHIKWAGDRLWIASGNRVYAGDLLNPLQMVENTVTASGGFFYLPGQNTGMGVTHDYKSLLVFTHQSTSAFQVGIEDRTLWSNTQDFQRVLFPDIGLVSDRCFVNQYGMSWWMSHDGLVALDSALQAYQTSRMHVRDHNMTRSKEAISWSGGGGCAGTYGNWLFFSVPSGRTDNGHTWMMDQSVVQSINDQTPPAWCSNWTGIRPEQWVTGPVNGVVRCFCISRDLVPDGHQATIWEAFIGQRMDVPKSRVGGVWTRKSKDIACAFETAFRGLSPSQYIQMRYVELDLAEIIGNVHLQVYYCGRRTSYKKILDKKLTATVSINTEEEFDPNRQISVYVPQFRTVKSVTDSHDADDNNTDIQTPYLREIDKEFSLLVTWTGQMAITDIRMFVDPRPDYTEGQEELDETTARRITAEGSGEILATAPPANQFTTALTSKYLSPLRPRWVEFPSYDSAVANGVFFVAIPTVNPPPGSYSIDDFAGAGKLITCTCETIGADIYYNINGGHINHPAGNTLYTAPFRVHRNDRIHVRAFLNDPNNTYIPSVEISGQYIQGTCAVPTMSPTGGNYPSGDYPKLITLATDTPGATIRYLVNNGIAPHVTSTSPIYTGPVSVDENEYLHAMTFKSGWITSLEHLEVYTVTPQCGKPTFTPDGGNYPRADYPKTITINATAPTPDAHIRYRLNNPDVEHGTVANSGVRVVVQATDTLYAIAQKANYENSETKIATYTITPDQVATPTITPGSGSYNTHNLTLTFHDATSGATIIYTVGPANDPPPDPTPEQPTGRISDGDQIQIYIGHKIVKAIAVRADMTTSNMLVAEYDHEPGGGN